MEVVQIISKGPKGDKGDSTTGANITSSGNIHAVGDILADGNITGSNINISGDLEIKNITSSGDISSSFEGATISFPSASFRYIDTTFFDVSRLTQSGITTNFLSGSIYASGLGARDYTVNHFRNDTIITNGFSQHKILAKHLNIQLDGDNLLDNSYFRISKDSVLAGADTISGFGVVLFNLDDNGNITSSGTISSSGDIYAGNTDSSGVILNSPNGTKYRLKVADDGTLSTEAI